MYESRSLIPSELRDQLVHDVSVLESAPEEEKDWHPGSNGQVLDLVHPSLYCFRIGKTYVRRHGVGTLQLLDNDGYLTLRRDLTNEYGLDYATSEDHQWLPTDFHVSDAGDLSPLGYINNLSPLQHPTMYTTIASILSRFIPLFEKVLGHAPILPKQPAGERDYAPPASPGSDSVSEEEYDPHHDAPPTPKRRGRKPGSK